MRDTKPHSQETIKIICDWYSAGKSYLLIAKEATRKFNYKFTKGSVSGIISRARHNGLSVGRASKRPTEKIPMQKPRQFSCHSVANGGKGKLLIELNENECCYYLGDPMDYKPPEYFCGAQTEKGPWCPFHEKIVYSSYAKKELTS